MIRSFLLHTLAPLFLVLLPQGALAQTTSNPEPDAAWSDLPSGLLPRTDAASAVVGSQLYVFGGFHTENLEVTNRTEVYDRTTASWTERAPLPHPASHVGAAVADRKVWIAGGFEGDEPGVATDRVLIYDPETDSWAQGPPLPARRASGTLARLGRTLHYVGGLMPNRMTDAGNHYVLDLDDVDAGWRVAAPLPVPRNHLASAVVGGKLYAIGGQVGHDGGHHYSALVHAYDFATDTWTRVADLPVARARFESSAFVSDGRIVIAGGVGAGSENKRAMSQVTVYDPAADRWTEATPLPARLIGAVAKRLGDAVIVSHGGLGGESHPQAAAWMRSPEAGQADTLGFWPSALRFLVEEGEHQSRTVLLWTEDEPTAYEVKTTDESPWLGAVRREETTDVHGTPLAITVDATGMTPGDYRGRIRASAPGRPDVELAVTITVMPKASYVFAEDGGLAVLEAEHFHHQVDRSNTSWQIVQAAGSIGSAVRAGGDEGLILDTDYALSSPELQYRLRFSTPGTYYVWARAWAASDDDDSFHVGVNGQTPATATRITMQPTKRWAWANEQMGSWTPATLRIESSGIQTISVYMREDGLVLDRLVFTTDAGFQPWAVDDLAESRREPVDGSTTTDSSRPGTLPDRLALSPNYPNPFNPATRIQYQLPRAADVTLAVYDVLGRRVAVLVDGLQTAGTHYVTFDAAGLPSGTYLYELRAGDERQIRSMLLLR